jgi:aminoglycoside 2'-N-acetyltransferase I
MTDRLAVRCVPTAELTPDEIEQLRVLLWVAFDDPDPEERFTEDDWQHALGGMHVVVDLHGRIASHASVVRRELHVGGRPLRTGYVEAVATAPHHQGEGLGTAVMREVGTYLDDHFQLGALGTGSQGFYERLGWEVWRGPSSVRTDDGERPTPDEDGYIMVRRTPATPPLDATAPISCEWRRGDVW